MGKKKEAKSQGKDSVYLASFGQRFWFFGFIFRFLVLARFLYLYLRKTSDFRLELLKIR